MQERAAGEAEAADEVCNGKAAPAFLVAWLRKSVLILGGIGHRDAGSVDEFDAASTPEVSGRRVALQGLGGMAMYVLEFLDGQSCACGTVGAGAVAQAGRLLLEACGLDLAKDFAAGGVGGEDLQEERPENKAEREEAFAAVGAGLGQSEEFGGDPCLEERGKPAEGAALDLLEVVLDDALSGWGLSSSEEGREVGEERVACFHI